jgi:hypothetical protein
MARFSTEATIGLTAEVGLAILERLHIREPLLIWGLFVGGLLLVFDSIIRGEWAENIADAARRRKKRTRMSVIAVVAFALFGWWVSVRMHNLGGTTETLSQTASHPQPTLPAATAPASATPPKPSKPEKKESGGTVPPAATPPQQPPINQDCGGGNCAASVGQQGGITAGQLNVDTDRRLSHKQIADIGAAKAACASMPFVNVTASSDEAKRYAYQLISALHVAGCHADLALPIPGLRPNIEGVHIGVRDLTNIDPSAAKLGAILSDAHVPSTFGLMEADFFTGIAFVLIVGAKESSPSAISSGQQGGITAGTINVASPLQAAQTQIEQHGAGSGAVGGGIATGPCSNVQVGGENNQASVRCESETTERNFTQDQATAIAQKLSATPAPFWIMTGSSIHGHDGKIRENIDEQGAFEIQLENLLVNGARWEDLLATGCKDASGLLDAKHADGIDGKDGNAPLEQFMSIKNGTIDVSLYNGPPGCYWPVYEEPFHGILIESPLEFMDAAKALGDELRKLMIRSRVRRADVFSAEAGKFKGARLPCILIHVGTT